jgi:type II secretory pathway predicted ATPase ExeA
VEHLSHFSLSEDPFANDARLSFYFAHQAFADTEKRLLRGASQGKGLCLLAGPGGSGKTMLVRHLLDSLEEEAYESVLLIPMPGVSDGRWILDRFARQLGVEEPASESSKLLGQLYEQLAVIHEDRRWPVSRIWPASSRRARRSRSASRFAWRSPPWIRKPPRAT